MQIPQSTTPPRLKHELLFMFEAAMRFGERRRCGSDRARCWQRQISLMLHRRVSRALCYSSLGQRVQQSPFQGVIGEETGRAS
jgi:hypothetical protein